ncbi:MAG TPA: hypothetical protein VGI10_25870 [Polyangiaceae bacterium]|jgi:hypothetical protein
MIVRNRTTAPFRSRVTRHRLGTAVCASLLVLLASVSARAQDKKELSKARAMFQQAIELEQAGNYPAALDQFREVGQVRMTPQVRFHIAGCEDKLGKLVAALGGYELALADADSVGDEFKGEVDQAVTRLRGRIPKLVIQRGKGAEAADIQLDGVSLGASSVGVPVPIDPGPHTISARAPSSAPFNQTVSIAEQEQKSIEITLEPEAQTEHPATVVTTSTADHPPAPPRKTRPLPYIIGGAGAASLLASGVLFVLHEVTVQDLENACPNSKCPPSKQGEVNRAPLYYYGGWITLGLGVAGLGTGITLLVLDSKAQTDSARIKLVPAAPGAVAGASLAGHF